MYLILWEEYCSYAGYDILCVAELESLDGY